MGCKVSTQHKTVPSSPNLKSKLPKKTSLRLVYPGSTSESPHNLRSSPSRSRRSDAELSILRSESRKSLGTMDNIRGDLSLKDKSNSPLIRIIGIGTPREGNMSEDSVKRSNESSDISPYNRSPKRDFTFHSGENSLVTMSGDSMLAGSNKQFNKYLSITPKPSEFFIQKFAGQNGLVKRGTFGASSSIPVDIKSEEEVDSQKKSHVKSMGEIQAEQHSLQAVDQEILLPDTPGFRSMATNVSTQNNFETTTDQLGALEHAKRRKDTFGEKKCGLDLDKVIKKLESERLKQDRDHHNNKESAKETALRGRLNNHPQIVITEKDETGSKYSKSSERNNNISNRTTQTIIINPPQVVDQEQQDDDEDASQNSQRRSNSVYSLISSQLTGKNKYQLFMEEKMKKMQVSQHEEGGMKKVFTTNLLDLLSSRKESSAPTTVPSTNKTQSPIIVRRQLRNFSHKSHDSEDSNTLTLSLVYGRSIETKKGNVEPLKFGALENFRGGEMVSPIGHVKLGSVTPYSNRTATGKQGHNVSEIHDDRTITNMDNLSRMDFDKYSFVYNEVREVDVNQYNSYDESIAGARRGSKKFTGLTQAMRTWETQPMKTLESEETYRKIAAYLDDRGMPRFDTEEDHQIRMSPV